MNWQCRIGALRELTVEESKDREWASPAFGIPKKNGTIRLMIDFRRIKQCLKQKEYPLPTIEEILQDISSFMLASVVDVNIGYLSSPLCTNSRKLLTISTQYGFFESYVLRF